MNDCECKRPFSTLTEFLNLVVVGQMHHRAVLAGSTAMRLLRMSPNGMWLETVRSLKAALDFGPCAI